MSIDPSRSSRFQSQFLVYRASAPLREKYSLPRAYVVLPDPLFARDRRWFAQDDEQTTFPFSHNLSSSNDFEAVLRHKRRGIIVLL